MGDAVLAFILLGVLELNWRYFYAATAFVPLWVGILIQIWVPESPTFLLMKGRRKALLGQLQKIVFDHWDAPINLAFRLTFTDAQTADMMLHDNDHLEGPSLRKLLQGTWRGTLMRISVICFGIAFSWYGLATWLLVIFQEVGVRNKYTAAMAFALSGLPGVLCCIVLINRVQPRRLLTVFLLLTAIACALFAVISPSQDSTIEIPRLKLPPIVALSVVCAFNSVSTAVFNALVTVWAAPYPIELQGLAIGWQSVWMRFGSIIAQLVDGFLLRTHHTGGMFMITAMVVAVAVCASCGLKPLRS